MNRPESPNLTQIYENRGFSQRVLTATNLAVQGHSHQLLKVSGLPFIDHPAEVLLLIADTREDPEEDILCAAVDHDLVEDAIPEFQAPRKIRSKLGPKVLQFVMDLTKDPSIEDWYALKSSQLQNLKHKVCPEALVIAAGDSSSNAKRNISDYAVKGEGIWRHFGGDQVAQLGWFDGCLRIYEDRIPNDPLTPMYGELVEQLHNLGGQEVTTSASYKSASG
jgi:hypothetical protein